MATRTGLGVQRAGWRSWTEQAGDLRDAAQRLDGYAARDVTTAVTSSSR